MTFPGNNYAPPGVYTRTLFENPVAGTLEGLKIPVFIGEGNEILLQEDLEVVRGSSSSVDQLVVQEDETGRAVVSVSNTGQVTLGAFNGTRTKFQVRNFPVVDGKGSGTTTNNRSAVTVTIDGQPTVVKSVDGNTGIIELVVAPAPTALVRVTYYFNRTDTLTTDNLSAQVTAQSAQIYGLVGLDLGGTYDFNASNNELTLTVDRGSETTIVFPLGSGGAVSLTAAQTANFITGAGVESLTASTYTNNQGKVAILFTADEDIQIGSGTANQLLGLQANTTSGRNRVFYTYQGPIVDGSNGGITTTDPANVTVKVDNIQVIPTAVNGQTRGVTLPFAPKAGSTVAITYYFNSWQNTFDYLANIGITEVLRAGITSNRSDFVEESDFILKDDVIVWGTASLITSGEHTAGGEFFGTKQITSTLIDNKSYLSPCTPVVNTATIPVVASQTVFTLPFQPTTGNGRNSPLGQSLFQTVSNNRIDLPTNRPDLVQAYWGFSVQDALNRGAVPVLKVDSDTSQITLQNPVPPGATVYATFYYNLLTDQEYTLQVVTSGVASVGTYTIQDSGLNDVFNPSFDIGTKSAGLSGLTIEFPSGSELAPDLHFESVNVSGFTGPVEEIVTVTFGETADTPAKFTVPGFDPYNFIGGASDKLRIKIDNADLVSGATGIDLSDPTGSTAGFLAHVLGNEVSYDASTGGVTYTLDATNNSLNMSVDGVLLSPTVAPAAGLTVADFATAINTAATAGGAAAPTYAGAARFNGPYTVAAGEYDNLTLHYTGDVSGLSGNQIITLAPGVYASATALAAQVNTQLLTINGGGGLNGTVTCTADANGRLKFTFVKAVADAGGFFEFISDALPAEDFAIIAGIDTDTATATGQTKILDADIAKTFSIAGTPLVHDRLILRNRLMPGKDGTLSYHNTVEQSQLEIQNSSGNTKAGLSQGMYGNASSTATTKAASLLGRVGFSGGQLSIFGDARDSQPIVPFYDGTGTQAANNVFRFTLDGVPVAVTFTASAGGTPTALGPETVVGSVIRQIQDALAALPGTPFGVLAAIQTALLVRQEGSGIRISASDENGSVVINSGSATGLLGFSSNASASSVPVQAVELIGALMSHASGALGTWLTTFATAATYFADEALAGLVTDGANNEFLFLQSQSPGAGSVIEFDAATTDDALRFGAGLGVVDGDGEAGERGISGFYVVSTDPNGSGSANTSVLNSGVGQDGFVGQTYRDSVTGLTFTILPRTGGLKYPTVSASFRYEVSKVVTTDSNLPIRALNGVELLVSNTVNVAPGDTAVVETFERGGNEPAVGDLYYITYNFTKQNFATGLYTKLSSVEASFGEISPDNPVSLATYLAFLNGAILVGIKQVQKEEGSGQASLNSYINALDDLAKPLPGGLSLDIITPLRGDSLDYFLLLSKHVDLQSDIRYRNERTAVIGVAGGTQPSDAGLTAQAIGDTRMRLVYPDAATLSLTDALNNTTEYLVEGPYLAASLVGSLVSPNLDVATPWTNRKLVGWNQLARQLDAVQQNQVAVKGVTVLEDRVPFISVRQGFTTDMSNILTKTPTIITISDEVQRQARGSLENFIGIKFLPGILTQIEGRLAKVLADLQTAQIIAAFTGVAAKVTADPTIVEAEAYYQPIFPLLYIILTFHLRSTI